MFWTRKNQVQTVIKLHKVVVL